ncbi:agmatinase: agmatinase (plasmid) [Rubrobacter radiotolerans]|uniref:Agmatinase n=1 Tax=Rubrobacter radiotolerans TaxID=42256 RepID=A0A023X7U3_RUBRA|nr:agmatinase [Rubrobacter radiotolerans]AHY48105.1 agmatinase: agmatinase [Rubrobacter radiotolerans]MDX5895379.1 agmatinase [Rubrobacter radiotolerans]SMC01729.1 agmatinase [Rubrobacter radiotolerans DSM 5868]
MTRYKPANSFETPRFSGVRTFMRLPHVRDLPHSDVAIVGAPFDTGASFRAGARFGPEGIRSVSHLLRPYNPALEVSIFEWLSATDYGDIGVVPGYIEESYERIERELSEIHRAGCVPVVLGGDHSIALPELRAAAAEHGPLALVQFDSHADTWDSYFGKGHNHGTPFRRAVEEGLVDTGRSVQVGMRGSLYAASDLDDSRELGFEVLTTDRVRELGLEETVARIRERVGESKVYLSFDVDFLDPAYAPGTGTPEIGGFTTREAQELLWGLSGARIVGADVVEVYPPYDPASITCLAAATVAYEVLSLIAQLKSRDATRGF